MDYRDRHVVVTGGTGALGHAVVSALIEAGAFCHVPSIDAAEAERFALRTDSGGAGRHRGGLGVDLTYRALQDCVANVNCERTKDPPWGLHGGEPGAVNEAIVTRADGSGEKLRKATGVALATAIPAGRLRTRSTSAR